MDTDVLEAVSLYVSGGDIAAVMPAIVFERDGAGNIVAPAGTFGVEVDAQEARVALRPLQELFAGQAKAPDFSSGPTPEWVTFFAFLESTVVRYCDEVQRDATDQEMEKIYAELKRRPEAAGGALRACLRAAAQLYVSSREVSREQYEAVLGRLAKSARTFSEKPISRNYLDVLRQALP